MASTNFSAVDRYNQEKRLAQTSVKAIRAGLKYAIDRTTYKKSGTAIQTANSRSVFKNERLQRITLKAPHYIFKQHYGFEGKKSNGINMRLRATNVLNIALENANVLENLATGIGEIRADEVTARINF